MDVASEISENLSDVTVTRRLRSGIFMLGIGLVMAAVFERHDVSPYTRLWLFIPFFFAENAFFQAVYKTCGFSALQGKRHTGDAMESIGDPKVRSACICRGKRQIFHTFTGAAILTGLFVWIG